MVNKAGFGGFSQLADELNGGGQSPQEGSETHETPDLKEFSEVMADRSNALKTVARDRSNNIRLAAMKAELQDTITVTVAVQEARTWAHAYANGQPLPEHLAPDEVEVIKQLAIVLNAQAATSVVATQARHRPAISGLRSLPALSPVK